MLEQHHRKKKRSPLQKGCGFAPSMSASFSVTKACKAECKALRQLGASNAGGKLEKNKAVLGLRCMTFGRMRNKLPSIVERWSKGVNIVFKCQIPCKSSRPTHKSGPWDDPCKRIPYYMWNFWRLTSTTSRFQDLPISASQCYWAHGSVATFCSKSTSWIYLFSNFSATQDSWDVLKEFWIYWIDPEFFGPFSQPLWVISNVISLSFLSKKQFKVHCFLVSLIRNQYKWCFKYLQVVFDKAMAIYAQLFHFRQQLRLLTYSNLVGQNPEMQNATMQNLHKKKHTQQFTQSSLSCIKLYLMTMNQTENPWVLCFCSASLPQPNLGDRFPIGFSCFFFRKNIDGGETQTWQQICLFQVASPQVGGGFLAGRTHQDGHPHCW